MGKRKSTEMKEVYVTYYTKEKGKLEFTEEEWYYFPDSSVTFHREDGPFIIYGDGRKSYYLNGKYYHKKAYYKKLEEIDNLPLSLKITHDEEWVRERVKKN